jgi:hypothetical protein
MQSEPPRIPWCASVEMSRKLVVTAHRLRSGHMPLNSFKFLMRKSDSPNCELCGVNDDVYHLLKCVRSAPVRRQIYNMLSVNRFDVGVMQSVLATQTSDVARKLYQLVSKLVADM